LPREVTDSIALVEELRGRGGMDRTVAIGLAFNLAGYATWLRALREMGVSEGKSAPAARSFVLARIITGPCLC